LGAAGTIGGAAIGAVGFVGIKALNDEHTTGALVMMSGEKSLGRYGAGFVPGIVSQLRFGSLLLTLKRLNK